MAAIVAALLVLAGVELPVLRSSFVLPLVLFLPGYAVTAAVFPRRSELSAARLSLAIGLSIAIDTLAAFALSLTPLQINPAPLSLLLVAITGLAILFRWRRGPGQASNLSTSRVGPSHFQRSCSREVHLP